MRVIAGRWKGRVLRAPKGDATRPTTDRVKESLFSILADRIEGAVCVDLCCGAGGLGIEALSRGAESCVFVDRSPDAAAVARRNLETVGAELQTWSVVRSEALAWLRSELDRAGPTLVIIADPPYSSDLALDICALAAVDGGRADLLVFEHEAGSGPETPPGWTLDRRRYGRSELSIMERER